MRLSHRRRTEVPSKGKKAQAIHDSNQRTAKDATGTDESLFSRPHPCTPLFQSKPFPRRPLLENVVFSKQGKDIIHEQTRGFNYRCGW